MKRLIRIIKWVLIILILFIITVNIPIVSMGNTVSDVDYSTWMSENISNDSLAIEITMLGAHDAFSNEINYFSRVDTYSADDIMKGIPGAFLKGFIVRQSITQNASPTELLESGVRYFDIRLSYTDGIWETKHNYISGVFEEIALEITTFLAENDGEFLILDFQHIHGIDYSNDVDYQLFYDMLEDYGLIDYLYDSSNKPLNEITYGDLTSNNTISRVIILDKFEKDNKLTYDYESSIRASWANNDNFVETIDFLIAEGNEVSNLDQVDTFVVMQAVTTMQMSPTGILNSFKTWSLLERATQFNNTLMNSEEFLDMLDSMPIIMVDYANSNDDLFNDNIMEIIIQRAQE